MREEGTVSSEAISLVKRNNTGKALDIARTARDTGNLLDEALLNQLEQSKKKPKRMLNFSG
jgi:hypothetical protein